MSPAQTVDVASSIIRTRAVVNTEPKHILEHSCIHILGHIPLARVFSCVLNTSMNPSRGFALTILTVKLSTAQVTDTDRQTPVSSLCIFEDPRLEKFVGNLCLARRETESDFRGLDLAQ